MSVRGRADAPSAYVISRRNWILGQMNSLGGVRYLEELDAAQEKEPVHR